MNYKLGLNHILNYNTFCFCLLCKKRIIGNVNFNYDSIAITHLESKEHESSCKALFKLCVPDPCCESDDMKYINILRNLAFDVSWEISNEESYVCKRGNNLRCLICEEVISNVFKSKTELEHVLATHLESDFHLKQMKSKASWIHHPNEDTCYIAFHKCFLFCSYCQKYIKRLRNILLQVAANHITTDLENTIQKKEREDQHKSVLEHLCLPLDLLSISDCSEQDSKESDLEIFDELTWSSSRRNLQTAFKYHVLNYSRSRKILDREIFVDFTFSPSRSSAQTAMNHHAHRDDPSRKILDTENDTLSSSYNICGKSETPATRSESLKGLQIIGVRNFKSKRLLRTLSPLVLIDLVNGSSLLKLNERYIEIKNKKLFCKVCKMFIQFNESGSMLKTHVSDSHNDILVQQASNFISKMKSKSKESSKFCLVLEQIALDKKYMSHLMFIENHGQNFFCILCKEVITFTSCGKYVESHFFQTHHLNKMFDISVVTASEKEQLDQQPEVKSKGNKMKVQEAGKKIFELLFNKNGSKIQPRNVEQPTIMRKVEQEKNKIPSQCFPQVSVIERRLLKALRLASKENAEVRMNLQFLIMRDETIFCTSCQKIIIVGPSRSSLFHHCISWSHIKILVQNAIDYLVYKQHTPECLEQAESDLVLEQFYKLLNKVEENDPFNATAPHLLFLIIENTCTNFPSGPSRIACLLCNEPIEFTVCAVEDHFLSSQHGMKTFQLNSKILSDSCSKTEPSGDQTCGSEFENAVNKLLEAAEHSLQQVIESNKQYVQLLNNVFSCVPCKIQIAGKHIKAINLSSIALHFKGKKHRELKQVIEKATAVENRCLPNIVSLNAIGTPGSKISEGSNLDKALLQDTLHKDLKKFPEVYVNEMFISIITNSFFCNICQETIVFSEDGSVLKTHCISETHNKILLKNASNYVSRLKTDELTSSSEDDKLFLNGILSIVGRMKPFKIITSHIKFLTVKNQNFFCLLCRKKITFYFVKSKINLSKKRMRNAVEKVITHLNDSFHGVKTFALSRYSTYLTSTVESEYNTLSTELDIPKVKLVAATKLIEGEEPGAACASKNKTLKRKNHRKHKTNSVEKITERIQLL